MTDASAEGPVFRGDREGPQWAIPSFEAGWLDDRRSVDSPRQINAQHAAAILTRDRRNHAERRPASWAQRRYCSHNLHRFAQVSC